MVRLHLGRRKIRVPGIVICRAMSQVQQCSRDNRLPNESEASYGEIKHFPFYSERTQQCQIVLQYCLGKYGRSRWEREYGGSDCNAH